MNVFNSRALRAWAAVLFLAVCPQVAQGASKRIELAAEACNYLLTFNPKKTDEARIRDTFELLVMPGWSQSFGQSAFSAAEIKNIDLAAIDRQCAESLDKVKSLKLLPLAGVDSLRGAVVAELEDSCRYDRLNAEGYRDPSVLRQYAPAAACLRYVDALEGKSDLTAMYDEVHRGRCDDNVNPKSCLADLQKKRGNAEEMRVEVQNFGWNNCAVAFNLRNAPENAEKRRKLARTFLKTYKAREVNCEEP